MPIVVGALAIIYIFIAFCADVMRDCAASDQLQYAAESAGIYAYSRAANRDGTYSEADANQNMVKALSAVAGPQAWNTAPAGLQWNEGVKFEPEDLTIMHNSTGEREILIQVCAKRAGTDAITQLFMPFVDKYAGKTNDKKTQAGASSLTLMRTAEVIGQPASRIGAGVPRSVANDYGRMAVLPLAISYSQFRTLSSPHETTTLLTIDLLSSKSINTPGAPGHVKGCFVNVVKSPDLSNYYGGSRGQLALSQLIGSLKYFGIAEDGGAMAPACVERGSMLSCFDTADAGFVNEKQQLLDCVNGMASQHYYIVPVISADPSVGRLARVVGFSRLKLLQTVNQGKDNFEFRFQIGQSAPMRNATFATGFAAVPKVTGRLISSPPSPGPFAMRTYSTEDNAFSPLARGVVLAPALSPREVN
jgi:hypothetical protein